MQGPGSLQGLRLLFKMALSLANEEVQAPHSRSLLSSHVWNWGPILERELQCFIRTHVSCKLGFKLLNFCGLKLSIRTTSALWNTLSHLEDTSCGVHNKSLQTTTTNGLHCGLLHYIWYVLFKTCSYVWESPRPSWWASPCGDWKGTTCMGSSQENNQMDWHF